MGCAPSIHVSQSGIVICPGQEDITGEGSSPRPRASSPSEIVGRIQRSSSDSGSRNSTSSSSRFRVNSYKKPQYSGRASSIEAETQTHDLGSMDDKPKADRKEIILGPMKLHQSAMQIMLVFAKEDAQSESFLLAAERGRFKCQLCKTSEAAMELYLNNQPEVIVIDMRGNSPIDGERLCKNIRTSRPNENSNSIILAVVKPCPPGADESSVLPLMRAGFDRRFVQNENVGGCFNELIMLEAGEVRSQVKLRAAGCLFAALEHTHDAVEITSIDPERSDAIVQYVNPAYEKMTGYFRDELIGGRSRSLTNSDQNKLELYEAIHSQLKKGKPWDGSYIGKRRNGEIFMQGVQIIPVGQPGKISHHVTVKRDMPHPNSLHNQVNMKMNVNMHMETPTTASSGIGKVESQQVEFSTLPNGGLLHRRQSTTTTRIEAPITKVINMLNAAQENSPLSVVQALDRVVEILRTAELYSPFTGGQTTEEDAKEAMPNDLVGGLINTVSRRRYSAGYSDVPKPSHSLHRDLTLSSKPPLPLHLPEAPAEVIKALVDEADWDFDIIKLEKGSNHRPLYYLGLKTMRRFRVCETLNIGEDVLKNWLQLIEDKYHSTNAYHNSTHAADVLHATAVFLAKERVKAVLEPLDEVASLIAAVVHDVDHPGYTNSFLCNAGDDLAVLYNDIAVLESHHSALAFKLTAQFERSNIFKGLDIEEFRNIRQSIIDMVMATEMTRHFEHLSKFVNSINKRRSSSLDEVHSVHSGRGTPDSTTSSQTALNTPENRTLIKRMLIKCADIANPARPRYLCKEWAFRISEEYFCQTDEEKRRGLPVVMPVFDRATCNVPRAQVWFIDYFVSDLYDAWDAFAFVPETIRHLTDNYDYWKRAAEELDAKKAAQAAQAAQNNSSNVTSVPSPSGNGNTPPLLTPSKSTVTPDPHSSSSISLNTSITSA